MPLGPGVRYRVKTYSSGKKVRLAFRGKKVVETKSLQTGETRRMGDVLTHHRRKGKFRRR